MPKNFHTVPIGEEIKSVLKTAFKDEYGLKSVSFGKVKSFLTKQGIQLLTNYVPGIFLEPIEFIGDKRNTENAYPFCVSYVRAFQPGQEAEKMLILESETIAQAILDHSFRYLLSLGEHNAQIMNWEVPKILYDNQTENFLRYISAHLTCSEIYLNFEVKTRR